MGESSSKKPLFQSLKAIRLLILIPILIYVTLVALGVYVAIAALHSKCPTAVVVSVKLLAFATFVRLVWLIINGCIQAMTASVMNAVKPSQISGDGESVSKSTETDRRRWFRLWRWWNRLGTLVLIFQVVTACLLVRNNDKVKPGSIEKRLETLLMVLPVAGLAVVVLGWFLGSEVMSWRALYTSNDAWKAHYSEAFRSYIRQALCCMGRYRLLVKEQGGEVYSVASLLGELVSYRAEGCSHLEALAGVSLLLRGDKEVPVVKETKEPVPEHVLREASILHQYAVAAYTGPLLEMGRYPFAFFCRGYTAKGVFPSGIVAGKVHFGSNPCPHWRPVLKGDNLLRGHAAAFVRHARLAPEDILREGRVLQIDRESAYFVVILKELQTIVVAVRGTETLEDLLTDGLSRETHLSDSDFLDLRKGPQASNERKCLGKHYAHRGIIEAARKLVEEIDKDDDDANEKGSSRRSGLLSKLLGPDGTHKNYDLRFVGHSLGGSICALTGLRLFRRYPKLRVYAYGLLPCMDEHLAEACKGFVTSVVCHDEFATRLSVASIMRLRAKALQALSDDTKRERAQRAYTELEGERSLTASTDNSSTASGRFSGMFSFDSHSTMDRTLSPLTSGMKKWSELRKIQRWPYMFKGGVFLCAHTCFCMFRMSQHHKATVISSEVERYVKLMTRLRNERQKTTDVNWKVERYVESMTRLDPPIPLLALTGSNRVTEDMGTTFTGTGDGQFVSVDMEMASYENEYRGGSNNENRRRESNLRRSGISMEMGSGFVNISCEETGAKLQELNPVEMYLPGLVLHLQKEENRAVSWWASFWYSWQAERNSKYSVVLADRTKFQDLVISPSMFIDHMPWKCQYGLNFIVSELKKKEEELQSLP